MKKLIPILMAGTLLFAGCGTDTSAGKPADAAATPQATESSQPLTEEQKDKYIQQYVENTLKEMNDMQHEVDMSDKEFVMVKVWKDGIVDALTVAKSGNQDAADAWKELREALVSMCNDLQEHVKDVDSDRTIAIMLMNDSNLENSLLTIMNGNVINDSFEDDN